VKWVAFTVVAALALALAPAAGAGGPGLLVGAAEDIFQQESLVLAKEKVDLARLAGLDAIRLTAVWTPGQTGPAPEQLERLQNAAGAAALSGVRAYIVVTHAGSKTTPLTADARAQFAQFAASLARAVPTFRNFIIGNEPNLNRFWLPQFTPSGGDAAAPAYGLLLARVYDVLKAVSPAITVIGGSLSPRGGDDPTAPRQTHSPTRFIRDLGAAYRASHRRRPLMDELAFHPYEDNSSVPPTFAHPGSRNISIADYPRLVRLLGQAFDGTPQRGTSLPIVYDEFGVESAIPPQRAPLYFGKEPSTTKPVDEQRQAAYYRRAIQLAFCQPTVAGIFVFHTHDETDLDRWQSGLYYADGYPKAAVAAVRTVARAVRGGTAAHCPGLELETKARVRFPTGLPLRRQLALRLTCRLDCQYDARVERFPHYATVLFRHGHAISQTPAQVLFPYRRLTPGRYRFRLWLTVPVNPGLPTMLLSRAFVVR
jgi:hypothetical protein